MTVNELLKIPGFFPVHIADGERAVSGGYCGDLLSWVMGKAKSSDAWITIMSNINVVAVASLSDVSCIILSESVKLDEDALKAAEDKEINVVGSALGSYETALLLGKNL